MIYWASKDFVYIFIVTVALHYKLNEIGNTTYAIDNADP